MARLRKARLTRGVPAAWAARVREALDDPELTSLRQQVAVLESMAAERIERRRDEGGSAERWPEVEKALTKLDARIEAVRKDPVKGLESLTAWRDELAAVVQNGRGAQQAESELREIFQEQRALAAAESRREETLGQMVSLRQLGTFVEAVSATLRRHVADEAARRESSEELLRLLP